mgnify:CR=1 FL=1
MKICTISILRSLICAFITLTIIGSNNAAGQTFTYPHTWSMLSLTPQPLYQQDTIEICFLGDIMMHTKQIINTSRDDSSHDFSSFFSLIKDDIESADLAIGNMEFTLGGKPYSGYPSFSAPDGIEHYLGECGFDILLLANNHIFDKGAAGAERTLERLRSIQQTHDMQFTGLAGSEEEMAQTTPLIVQRNGISLAIINCTYGTNVGCGKHWPKTNYIGEKARLKAAFDKAKEKDVDFIIALPHWGTEYTLSHSESQENTAKWLIECGADVIIGAHPHVIQDYQEIDGVPVAYSLGNAVSNMSAINTQLELMATIRIVRHSNGDLEMLTPTFKYLWCSLPGGYNRGYTVIPVEDFLDKKDLWHGKWDYDKMKNTYNRIKR